MNDELKRIRNHMMADLSILDPFKDVLLFRKTLNSGIEMAYKLGLEKGWAIEQDKHYSKYEDK